MRSASRARLERSTRNFIITFKFTGLYARQYYPYNPKATTQHRWRTTVTSGSNCTAGQIKTREKTGARAWSNSQCVSRLQAENCHILDWRFAEENPGFSSREGFPAGVNRPGGDVDKCRGLAMSPEPREVSFSGCEIVRLGVEMWEF
jgi:hypothetical protein